MQWSQQGNYLWACEPAGPDPSSQVPSGLWRVVIQGAKGTVSADNIVCVYDRFDYIDDLYWLICSVLDGHYHCCLSGRVSLV